MKGNTSSYLKNPKKKRALENDFGNIVEGYSSSEDNNDIIDEAPSPYEKLLNSLPILPQKRKKKEKKYTKEEKEIIIDQNDNLPIWNIKKTNDQIDLHDDISNSEESEKSISKEDEEEENEEDMEEINIQDNSIGINYRNIHFEIPITKDHLDELTNEKTLQYSKVPLVSEINEFLSFYNKKQSAVYSPLFTEYDHSKDDKIQILPINHTINVKRIKKQAYTDSIKECNISNKLKESFHNTIGKQMKYIKNHHKKLISNQTEETISLPSAKELHRIFSLLYPIFDQYYDIFYSLQTLYNAEIIRSTYLLHVVNHIQKNNLIVEKNTHRIKKLQNQEKLINKEIKYCKKEFWLTHPGIKKKGKNNPKELQTKLDEFDVKLEEINEKQGLLGDTIQDQGFTRASTLILVPSQEIAGSIVENIMNLYPTNHIHHKKRFYEFFLPKDRDLDIHGLKKPDYNALFYGNTNDSFYICLRLASRVLKLFSDPYDSDIIIASPIGLRSMIDKKEDARGRHDFLSSIEICILDLSDVFMMQNWEHVQFLFKHLNCIPELTRDTDFSRVKPYFLEGWAKYYRQTIILSQYITPEIQSLCNRQCFNHKGKIRFQQTFIGEISNIKNNTPQQFEKISCSSITDINDRRYNYFIEETLPQLQSATQQNHTLIYIPSYFDFVRIRNYFKQERISFVSVNEYADNSEVARARTAFYKGISNYLLVTERFYFFKRYKISGTKRLIFYAPPQIPSFYTEILHMIDSSEGTTTTLYIHPYDQLSLQRIVGNKRLRKMKSSPKNTHLFISGK